MPYRWVVLWGNYEFRDQEIVFHGGEREYAENRRAPSIGNAICDQVFSGGEISAKTRFDVPADDSGCEIIMYFEPATKYFVSAGIGATGLAEYGVRYFDSRGWNLVAAAGERKNLRVGVDYDLRVTLNGALVSLWSSGIEVIRATVPFTLPAGQVGLWNRGLGDCVIRDYTVVTERPTAFVAMQFSPPYNELFADVIKPICEEFKITAIRSDETFTPGLIIADIVAQINAAKLIIADITPENSNVFYEVGYSHALRKPTILVAEKGRKLPFDVSGFRTLFYENTIAGKRVVEEGLRKHLKAILTELQIPTSGPPVAPAPSSPAGSADVTPPR